MSKIFTKPHLPIYPGGEPHDFTDDGAGNHGLALGIYTTEDVQRYVYGTRLITWDGRVYKYSNAVAVAYSYHGAFAYENAALSWGANAVAFPAGSRVQQVAIASRAIDDLAGAYLVTIDISATTTTYLMGIVGNEKSVDTTTLVYTDAPLPILTTTNDKHEVYENPYRETKAHAGGSCAIICVPAQTSQAGYKYWGQTYGPAYISPSNSSLDDPGPSERTVYWAGEGTTGTLVEAALAVGSGEEQIAGFILNADIANAHNIAGPMIMLAISI
jgi:hypothetical protein